MREFYRPIVGYEGIYEVSNYGNVRTSKDKITHSELHGERHWKQRVLKQKTDKSGYKRVTLWKDKKPKDYLVHRLVAMQFIPQRANHNLINHIDCNPANNKVSNLEWVNYSENLEHAYDHELNPEHTSIVLVNKETKEPNYFNSLAKASRFLGRNSGYMSGVIKKKNIKEIDGYEIYRNVS